MGVLDTAISWHWTVTLALTLAGALFVAKFLVARTPMSVDFVLGAAEAPIDISAACCSLIIAYMAHPASNTEKASVYLIVVVVIFLLNAWLYRVVEAKRPSPVKSRALIIISIAASLALSYFCSISAVVRLYGALPS